MAADPRYVTKRYAALKARRANHEGHCEEIARLVMPNHQGFVGAMTPGAKRMQYLYDSTGIRANELLAAGLHGLLSNPASKWFSLRVVDSGFEENDEVKNWLADTSDVMRAYMYAPGSNITTALHETYLQLGAFGCGPMYVGERDKGGLLFQARPMHECYIAENHEDVVDTVYRRTMMTARQIAAQWPDTTPGEVSQKIADGKPDETFEVIHAVEPRKTRDGGKLDAANMPWQSCYVMVKGDALLEESGYPEFPYAVPRWSRMPGEEYGRSPAMTALPDLKTLQEVAKTDMKIRQRNADPVTLLPDDGVVGPVRTVPGGFIYYRGDQAPSQLPGGNSNETAEKIEWLTRKIDQTFFADLLQFPIDVNMTATEFTQRMAMRMQLLGPVMGRMESELLARLVERTYGVLSRGGIIPPVPPELDGREWSIEFVSPIAMSQKQGEAGAISQTLAVLLPFVEATKDPSWLRVFKKDDTAKAVFEIFGGDPDLVHSDKELAAKDKAEAQAAQAQQMAATVEPMANAMNQGAGAVEKLANAQEKGADVSQLFRGAA